VVNLPREKRVLIPENCVIKSLREKQQTENACVLIDEGTTMIRAGATKIEEAVKSFTALARQRSQIILFIFHASSDVGSRILRGVDVILLKEPSQRQIQFGSKDNWMKNLLEEAKEKFKAVRDIGADVREFVYVDCEEPEFRGLLRNSLCTFWNDELSRAWSGVDTIELENTTAKQLSFDRAVLPRVEYKGWLKDDADRKAIYPISPEMMKRAREVERHYFDAHGWVEMEDPITGIVWLKQVY